MSLIDKKDFVMKKIHLICNAHLDPIWQWEWEEGASAALSTFQSAANLAKKHDYIFCHNEVTLYRYTQEFAPELFKEIQAEVKQGRWHIMGGWYLQPDCLLPVGEGFVRQIQEGKRYFKKEFGVWPTTAVNFDPFGHSRGLVQIIKKCGQDSYLFMRPYGKYFAYCQEKLPSEIFTWVGYDGSTIKACRTTSYSSNLGHAREKIEEDMSLRKEEDISLSTWGVGNHGGGPSDKDLYDIEALQKESPIPVVHSTPEAFFAEVEPKEKFAGSLISCMVGCYTSMVGMKQAYRELERQLFFSEKIASAAYLDGKMDYPTERFESAVDDLLNVEFHDILPGTMIQAGEKNGMTFVQHGLHDLNQIRAKAFFALIQGQKPAEANTYPIFVFNPKANDAEQLVECDLSVLRDDVSAPWATRLIVKDEDGNVLPSQNIKESSNLALNWRKKVVFLAHLKPLGITRFTACAAPNPEPVYPLDQDIVFDNGEKKVVISAKTGLIESYQIRGQEMANGALFQPKAYRDYADPWGMNYDHVGEEPHPFSFLAKPDGVFAGLHGLEVIEDGEVYLGAEAFFAAGLTRMRIGYKLYKKGTRVDVDVTLFPAEINQAYKVALPLKGDHFGGEQVFGYEELFQDGRECVAHDYLALEEEGGRCLAILTPDSYGSSYHNGEIALTLLRTATYCAHPISKERPLLRSNIFIEKIDQGERHFRFSLLEASEGELKAKADLFAEAPFALNVFPTIDHVRGNEVPVRLSNPEINLVTLKKSLEKDGMVLRLQNCSKTTKKCRVQVGKNEREVTFTPYEVKTILSTEQGIEESPEMLI